MPAPASAEQAAKVDQLVTSGRSALEAGDLDTALANLTQATSLLEAPRSAEAKELLGVTRERRGQLAHAKGEYDEYLAMYPEGEGAVRVRQRLDALIASQLAKLPSGRDAAGEAGRPAARGATRFAQYGSVSTSYRRYIHTADSVGSLTTDSSMQLDGTYVARGNVGSLALRGQLAGAYRFDLLEGMDQNEARISSVFIDVSQVEGPFSALIGRQPGNTAGVLSRFDGVRLRGKLGKHWRLSIMGGMPVDYYHSLEIDTDRYLYGLSVDAEELLGGLDGQIFAVQQRAGNLVDRTALGAELRWHDDTKFISSHLDYDIDYALLNTALLVANWRATPATNLNLLFDYRKSPILTTTNALFGQTVDTLSELQDLFTNREIRPARGRPLANLLLRERGRDPPAHAANSARHGRLRVAPRRYASVGRCAGGPRHGLGVRAQPAADRNELADGRGHRDGRLSLLRRLHHDDLLPAAPRALSAHAEASPCSAPSTGLAQACWLR